VKIVRKRGFSLPERAFPIEGNVYLSFNNGTVPFTTTKYVLRGEEGFPSFVLLMLKSK
jgi:hypothetical protein